MGVNTNTEAALAEIRAALGDIGHRDAQALASLDRGWDPANFGAGAMVTPSSTLEVAEVVRICARHGVGIVPHGGRTGLVGGGVSRDGEIILSLGRMNRIVRLDATERVAVVEAGATLQSLQEAATQRGLEPGIDLAARGSATIGGMVSTDAGGMMAFRYGVMRHRVLGLEAVLPDGTILSDLTRVVKVAAGYDVKQLLIGAEGTLGIVTRVAVKLEPLPRATATALFGLPSVAAALELIELGLAAEGGHLRVAEVLWRPFLALNAEAQGWREASYDMNLPVHLLMSLGGANESDLRSAFETMFGQLLERHPEASGIVASSERQDRELFLLREDTATVYRAYPAAPSYDVSVPLSEIDAYVERVARETKGLGLAPFMFGHLADGNLHLVFNHAGALNAATTAAVEAILYRDLRALGGSFSAEHGVGSKRIHSLLATVDPGKLEAMRIIKQALDPKGVMNPGKVLPSGA